MKKFIFLLLVVFISCNEQPRQPIYPPAQTVQQVVQPYQTIQTPNGAMVIFKDDNGVEQMMELLMFQSLLNNNGGNCWNCVYKSRNKYYDRRYIDTYRNSNTYKSNYSSNYSTPTTSSAISQTKGIQSKTIKHQEKVVTPLKVDRVLKPSTPVTKPTVSSKPNISKTIKKN